MFPDIFNSDAFSLATLTTLINQEEHIPGLAGNLAFAGVGEGVATTEIAVEISNETLSLVQTSARGGPSPVNTADKNTLKALTIPHIKLEETIGAHQIQGVREFGSMSQLRGARSVVDKEIRKQTRRMDLTVEHLRLGALQGHVLDADGTTSLADLFALFNVSETVIDFNPVFDGGTGAPTFESIRTLCQEVTRGMKRALKAEIPGARIYCFAGDNFFDKLIECTNIKGIWDGWFMAEQRLAGNYAWGDYLFADIVFNNYQGTNDQTRTTAGKVGVDPNTARFFFTNVPGLYEEYYAPADFMETVNTIGLPRYAKVGVDPSGMNRFVNLHTQMNPLPICTKPATLFKGTSTLSTGDF